MPWGKDQVVQPAADQAASASSGSGDLPSWGRSDQKANVVSSAPDIRALDVMRQPSLGDVVNASLYNNRDIDAGKIASAQLGQSVGDVLNAPALTPVEAPEAAGRGFVSGGGKLLQTLGTAASLAIPSGQSPLTILRHPELGIGAPALSLGNQAVESQAIGPGEYLPDIGSKVAFQGAELVPQLAGALATGGASSAEALVPSAVRSVPVLGKVVGNIAAGAPTAAALTGEQAATTPDIGLGDIAKMGALNLATAGIPGAVGEGQLERTLTGGAIGGGIAAGSNYLAGQPFDPASTIVGSLTGAALAGGHASAEKLDPYLARYQASANEPPPVPAGPARLPAPEAPAATAEPIAPVAPVTPAKFDPAQATRDFQSDPKAALAGLDHPTLTQLASDVGVDIKPGDSAQAIATKIAAQPAAFLHSDVLPEYLAAAQDAHEALQAAQPEPQANIPAEPPISGLGDLARSLSPSSVVPVDAQGTAYTPEQGMGSLAAAIQSQAGAATRALPPAVTTVDSAGVATNSEVQNRQIAQRLADEQAGIEASKAKRDLGITPDIERTQGPRWEQLATNADDLRAMQDARDAENSDIVGQRSDDAPEWWVAGQHAADAFDQHVTELAQERQALSQPERQQATEVLDQAGIKPEDHDEALTVTQLVERALDAGAAPQQILLAGQEPDNASRARALWALTNRLEGSSHAEPSAIQQAGAGDRAAPDEGVAAAGAAEPARSAGGAEDRAQAEDQPAERGGELSDRVASPSVDIDQTQTPAFKRWFGDSKITQDWEGGETGGEGAGDPRVLYHATRGNFDTFRAAVDATDALGSTSGPVIFMGSDASDIRAGHNTGPNDAPREGVNVMPVYASIKNPLQVYVNSDARPREATKYGLSRGWPYLWTNADVASLKNAGYDGATLFSDDHPAEVVAFEPSQVKSAIANSGEFDPSNPSIVRDSARSAEARTIVPPDERRPDWNAETEGKAITALDDLVKHYGGSTLADSIRDDLRETTTAKLIGQKIGSPEDLAALASVYRNPAFETMRYVYVNREGIVLGETAVSSRMPASSVTFPQGQSTTEQWIHDNAPKGASQVWMIHNHPTGDPIASKADVAITQKMSIKLGDMAGAPKLAGHVILDHDTYGYIDGLGEAQGVKQISAKVGTPDPLLATRGDASMFNVKVTSPEFAAVTGKKIAAATPADSSAIVIMDAAGRAVSIHTFPNDFLVTPRGAAMLGKLAERRGGTGIGLVTSTENFAKHRAVFDQAGGRGLFRDAIVVNNEGKPLRLNDTALFPKENRGPPMSRSKATYKRNDVGERVYEPDRSEPAPVSLQAVRRALEARGMSPEAIANMSREQLRAEQALLRARSEPTPAQVEGLKATDAEGKVTGIKNATKEEERGLRGKAAVEHDLEQTNPEQYARAKAAFDADPHAGQLLAAKVIASPKALTPEESILLSLDAMRIINARQRAYEQASEALDKGDEATRTAALSLAQALDGQLEANDIAARYSGTKAGQALQARKVMIAADYSMARMMLRAKVAKGGELTGAERAKIEEASAEIQRRMKELDEREAKLRAKEAAAKPEAQKKVAKAKFDDLVKQLKAISQKEQLKPGCVV